MRSDCQFHNFRQIRHYCRLRFRLYIQRYIAFARLRGYNSFNDWPYHRRGFIECWAQPGFHRFWQIWNPGISYFVYRLYLKLGGNKNWIFATLLAFEINGLIHSALFYLLSGQWSFVIPVCFLLFGVLTVLNKSQESLLQQNRWPWLINTILNIALVIISFDISFRINDLIYRYY